MRYLKGPHSENRLLFLSSCDVFDVCNAFDPCRTLTTKLSQVIANFICLQHMEERGNARVNKVLEGNIGNIAKPTRGSSKFVYDFKLTLFNANSAYAWYGCTNAEMFAMLLGIVHV